jgi:aspartyl-tRNA(Asn)/glutamyl-tRNA(Gln) amidotransferase subunit B
LGVKVEIKNLNSFKSLGDAIQYELKRQEKILREKGEIIQETRGWNEKKGITESQRAKESAHDYRYFPEPDLPPLDLTPGFWSWDINDLKNHLPELPAAKRLRFSKEYAINDSQIEVLISDRLMAKYFEEAASELKARISEADYQLLINYLTTDLRGLMKEAAVNFDELKINPEEFAHLIFLIQAGSLSSRLAKDILRQMFETGEDPEVILKEAGLKIIEAKEELEAVVEEVLKSYHQAVSDYKKGKRQALQFLLGQVMAKTKGQASPQKVNEILIKKLAQL